LSAPAIIFIDDIDTIRPRTELGLERPVMTSANTP
jgi:hypothetical protein